MRKQQPFDEVPKLI